MTEGSRITGVIPTRGPLRQTLVPWLILFLSLSLTLWAWHTFDAPIDRRERPWVLSFGLAVSLSCSACSGRAPTSGRAPWPWPAR